MEILDFLSVLVEESCTFWNFFLIEWHYTSLCFLLQKLMRKYADVHMKLIGNISQNEMDTAKYMVP
jgi:hypothetical protein